MRNILAITAALILLISFSACGLDGNEPESISAGLDGIVGRIESFQTTPDQLLLGERSNEDDIYSILGYISTYQNIIKNKATFSLMYYKFLANNLEKFYKMEIIVGFWEAYSYKFNVDICSFNSIDIDKKKPYISIWDMYAKAAERKLFDIKNGLFSKKITEFYKDKLSKINIIIWNIDRHVIISVMLGRG